MSAGRGITRAAVAALLVFGSVSAWAGYAEAVPPPGSWAQSGTSYTFDRAAANAPAWVTSKTATSAVVNVSGRAVTMPAAMRLASNAASYAVSALRLTPTGFLTAAAATWMLGYGLEYIGDQWVKREETTTRTCVSGICTAAEAVTWLRNNAGYHNDPSFGYDLTLTNTVISGNNITFQFSAHRRGGLCCDSSPIVSGTFSDSTTTDTRPAVESDFGPPAAAPALPDPVANAWPGPLPVEIPVLNPDPAGNPQPLPVPVGSPVPIPGTDPQKYEQPIIDVRPFPSPLQPWRVDLQPRTVTGTDPNGLPDPVGAPAPTSPVKVEFPEVDPPPNPGMPAQPTLYTRKYPDGLIGVWNTKKAELQATPFFSFISTLAPNVGDGGCPAWSIPSGSVLGINVGGAVGVPCYVWAFIRLVMIISALLLARRLIFGG